jgi:ABC-type cobalamin transport system permease subunit
MVAALLRRPHILNRSGRLFIIPFYALSALLVGLLLGYVKSAVLSWSSYHETLLTIRGCERYKGAN